MSDYIGLLGVLNLQAMLQGFEEVFQTQLMVALDIMGASEVLEGQEL